MPGARIVSTVVTFYSVCLAWGVFRAEDTSDGWTVLKSLIFLHNPSASMGLHGSALIVFVGLAVVHDLVRRSSVEHVLKRLPATWFAAAYGVAAGIALSFASVEYVPFIYFQF